MNRTFKPNRQGITLLFVISMIVLFLLMGTAFVIVANDFNRASISRIRSNVPEGKGTQLSNQLLEDAMLQIIRGPSLDNIDSPLRVNDILSDQYGFGRKAYVAENPQLVGGGAFVEITLKSDPRESEPAADGAGIELLTLTFTPRDFSPNGLSNSLSGQVLSFTSGPAKGFSARIYTDFFSPTNGEHTFRIPTASVTGDLITSDSGDLVTTATVSDLFNSEVIINGRDFSGTGASVMFTGVTPSSLGNEALLPNRVGQSHRDLVHLDANANAYLVRTVSSGTPEAWEASVNEPWDAADIATMFLSGFDKAGNIIPSFYREANTTAPSAGGSATFHAFDEGGDVNPGEPDVDTDGDGENDSFWMDLGSSIATNRNGQRFKPLFAIHIRDLDGLLNVNAHGNRTHADSDGFVGSQQGWALPIGQPPETPRGSGMGVAEIDLLPGLSDNTTLLTQILDARYGDDGFPGNGTNSFRSRAKLFGYPDNEIDPGNDIFGTVGGLYGGSPMDIYGRFLTGTPVNSNSGFDNFVDPNYPDFNNGLPQINMLTTDNTFARPDTLTDEFSGNPYEMSLSGASTFDTPFTTEELERVLRPFDLDSQVLPDRLSTILDGVGRGLLTTDSYDVPMLHQDFITELVQNISRRNPSLPRADIETLIPALTELSRQFAFAPELFRGLKMDINRPFGDGRNNGGGNDVIDEPDEEVAANNTDASGVLGTGNETNMDLNFDGVRNANDASETANPRVIYARHLYMLAMLLMEPVDLNKDGTLDAAERLEFAKAIAQWSVNVVDFRDPDSIHTRFVYDPFPWDTGGWNPENDADGNPLNFVWGAERPELLLTETLAVHIQNIQRNTADTAYEQRLRPEPFAYFEVYNPWTQNRLNQRFPRELSNTNGAVNLGRVSDVGNSPVWRFEVERVDTSVTPVTYKPLRYVYMTPPISSLVDYDNENEDQVEGDIEVFFNSGNSAVVRPGRQALIGTRGFTDAGISRVFMGRHTLADDSTGNDADLMLDETTRLALRVTDATTGAGTVTRYTGDGGGDERFTSIVFIDKSTTGTDPNPATVNDADDRKFSLSDPYEGYPDADSTPSATGTEIGDGFIYDTAIQNTADEVDGDRITLADLAMIRSEDGTNKNFRYVRLQRLANPLIGWEPITNPYLTIDSMEVDLVSINGADPVATAPTPALGTALEDYAVSHERGIRPAAGSAPDRVLWGYQRQVDIREVTPAPEVANSDLHFYEQQFSESLGKTNDSFDPNYAGVDGTPFPWLTWNNRPFVSHMEIMNVPYLAPDRLTYAPEANADPSLYPTQPFTIDDDSVSDPYGGTDPLMATRAGALAGRYGHLLNFFAGEDDTTSTTNAFSDAYKILDFIEVPSRFVGNESYYLADGVANVFRHPFNTISRYRVPGLINVNTIPPREANPNGSAVWDAMLDKYNVRADWGTVKESLYGDYNPDTGPDSITDFENPFRPTAAANLVPGGPTITNPASCTLMRPRSETDTMPLLDHMSESLGADNTKRSAAFRNGLRTRLGNMVTTKSSVFACWITVGYFEVNSDNQLLSTAGVIPPQGTPAAGTVTEIGADTGEQVRDRAFFIFDRSIPVAFEPGKNHNVEKAILTKSLQIDF